MNKDIVFLVKLLEKMGQDIAIFVMFVYII
jgi:hypothetical protein